MGFKTVSAIGMLLLATAVILLTVRMSTLVAQNSVERAQLQMEIAHLQDSLIRVDRDIDTLRIAKPGLGEYMSTLQLHAGKLWFAARAGNWPLADYEQAELLETMQATEGLHAVKNNVETAPVLQSVEQTQVAALGHAIAKKDPVAFTKGYDELLVACNACHKQTAHTFVNIIRPKNEPVTNQNWGYKGM